MSTSRSMWSTPTRDRHFSSCSGSGPVSMSAIAPAERRSTASPWPTSHARMLQSVGRVNRPATEVSAALPARMPATTASRSTAAARTLCGFEMRAGRSHARHDDHRPDRQADGGESGHARPALEPRHLIARQRADGLRGAGDPRRGQPGDRCEPGLHPRQRRAQAGGEPDDRRDRCGRRRQQVRDDAVQRHRRCDDHQQRSARELRGERHRQGEGHRARHALRESGRERPGPQQQRAGRDRREREPQRPREPGIAHQQHSHGEARAPRCPRRFGRAARPAWR